MGQDQEDTAESSRVETTGESSRASMIDAEVSGLNEGGTRLTDLSPGETVNTTPQDYAFTLPNTEQSNTDLNLEEALIVIGYAPYPESTTQVQDTPTSGLHATLDGGETIEANGTEQTGRDTDWAGLNTDLSIDEAANVLGPEVENAYEYFRTHGDLDGYRHKRQPSYTKVEVPDSPVSQPSFRDMPDEKWITKHEHEHDFQYDNGDATYGLWPAYNYVCKGCGSAVPKLGPPRNYRRS